MIAALVPLLFAYTQAAFLRPNHHLSIDFEHGLYAPYASSDGRNSKWDFDALVSTHEFVQLTPMLPQTVGHAFAKKLFEADEWNVEFAFRISANDRDNAADGMAFWFTNDWYTPGRAFGNNEYFRGLGVFFDLHRNNANVPDRHYPWISAMVNDGKASFDHDSDGHGHTLGGCHRSIVNTEHPVHARVTYHGRVLSVALRVEDDDWQTCFEEPNVMLPRSGYLGFSAHTGGLAARHDLLAVTTWRIEMHKDYSEMEGALLGSSLFSKPMLGNGLSAAHSRSLHNACVALFFLSMVGVAGYGIYAAKKHHDRRHF